VHKINHPTFCQIQKSPISLQWFRDHINLNQPTITTFKELVRVKGKLIYFLFVLLKLIIDEKVKKKQYLRNNFSSTTIDFTNFDKKTLKKRIFVFCLLK